MSGDESNTIRKVKDVPVYGTKSSKGDYACCIGAIAMLLFLLWFAFDMALRATGGDPLMAIGAVVVFSIIGICLCATNKGPVKVRKQ